VGLSRRKLIFATVVTLGLTGCAFSDWQTNYRDVIDPELSKNWRVSSIDVQVPASLTVSEANTFAPNTDIVWRGEPYGDRHVQVDKIITQAAQDGSANLKGSRAVRLVIVMRTFHALTERTRYTLQSAGVHNISFSAQVFDAKSGLALTPVDEIRADLVGYTGNQALASEARGETQKSRILNHVTRVIAGWLGTGEDVRRKFNRSGR